MTSRIQMPRTAKEAMHTAGIYSDMTVDGPEIGDLVIIVDKAKNLPNRKTMGKQDPYCAARLGKEAKKTETDKRGGQTPKWDKELRFTVRDSADYYQLKVSVFNDDKKTDLIGEAWIDLAKVVVRGGGRSDGWHNLNCRGRYAGEIRIELTYYDIRPREEKVSAQTQANSSGNGVEPSTLAGPRQPKQVKRRPLPTDPTGSSPQHAVMDSYEQSPNPYDPQPPAPVQGYPMPADYASGAVQSQDGYGYPAPRLAQHRSHASLMRSSVEPEPHYAHSPTGAMVMATGPQHAHAGRYDAYDPTAEAGYGDMAVDEYDGPVQPAAYPSHPQQHPDDVFGPPASAPLPPSHTTRYDSPAALPGASDYASPAHYSPSNPMGTSPPQLADYHQASPRYAGSESRRRHGHRSMQPTVEDETMPPAPPTHRSSAHHGSFSEDTDRRDRYDPRDSPAPLNITNRHSVSPTPYSPYNPQRGSYAASTSPASMHSYMQSGGPSPTRGSHQEASRRESRETMGMSSVPEGAAGLPPSLIPGYSPKPRETASREGRSSHGHHAEAAPAPLFHGPPTYSRHSVHAPGMPPVVAARSIEEAARSMHRASAPLIKPRAISPNPHHRVPARKSVSPQPTARSEDISLSGMPFSPDAYDAFNPNAGSPSTTTTSAARYTTPEGAEKASRQYQLDSQREEGPIIGPDGREIDPSDHLPSDTWAPEPVRKNSHAPSPRSARPSPQGAQPMPPSTRRHPRHSAPQGTSVASYISGDDPQTPPSGSRNRLQKKGRVQVPAPSPTVAASSPLGVYDSRHATPQSQSAAARAYPLREHENFGQSRSPAAESPYGAGSGSGARNSPAGAGAPPIPAKIAMRSGRDEYSALSEELKSIDIGVGSGGRRGMRRSQY